MTFREMTVEDLDQIAELEQELFSVPWSREGYLSFLIRDNTLMFVVEEKGRILGYCGLIYALDEGDVMNIAVRKDRQREGIGQFMVDSMIRMAAGIGVMIIHLEVRESNAVARRLYQRMGFVEDGLRKNYYQDPTEHAVLMTKHGDAADSL